MTQPQLAAGGVGVFAAGAAEHGLDAIAHEDVEEHEHRLVRRHLEVGALVDGREGNSTLSVSRKSFGRVVAASQPEM